MKFEQNRTMPECVERALAGLSQNGALRRMAYDLVASGQPPAEVGTLLNALGPGGGRGYRRRVVAAWLVGQCRLTGRPRDAAIRALQQNLTAPYSPFEHPVWGPLRATALGLLAGALFTQFPLFDNTTPMGFLELGGVVFLVWRLIGFGRRRSLPRAAAAQALGEMGVAELSGLLAGAARFPNPEVREAAVEALLKVLPLLNEEDYGSFGRKDLAAMVALLPSAAGDVTEALLEALKAVGTPSLTRDIERYRDREASSHLRARADEVLAVLELRRSRERDPQVLGRPAAGPSDGSHLLRPASAGAEAAEHQLVRPAECAEVRTEVQR